MGIEGDETTSFARALDPSTITTGSTCARHATARKRRAWPGYYHASRVTPKLHEKVNIKKLSRQDAGQGGGGGGDIIEPSYPAHGGIADDGGGSSNIFIFAPGTVVQNFIPASHGPI